MKSRAISYEYFIVQELMMIHYIFEWPTHVLPLLSEICLNSLSKRL